MPAFGQDQAGGGRLGMARALAVDEAHDRVYVADHATMRIVVYTMDGVFVADWPSVFAAAMVSAPDGTLWVTDRLTARVRAFDQPGRETIAFGSYGDREDDQFRDIGGIALSETGLIFVGDMSGQRIRVFREVAGSLKRIRTLDLTRSPYRGRDFSGERIRALGPERIAVGRCEIDGAQIMGNYPTDLGGSDLCGITLRAGNDVAGRYVAVATHDADCNDPWNAPTYQVFADFANANYDLVLSVRAVERAATGGGAGLEALISPSRLSVASDGSLYVTDAGRLQRMSAAGVPIQALAVAPHPSNPDPTTYDARLAIGDGTSDTVVLIGQRVTGQPTRPIQFQVVAAESVERRFCRAGRCATEPYLEVRWRRTLPAETQGVAAVDYDPIARKFLVLYRMHSVPHREDRGMEVIVYRLAAYDLEAGQVAHEWTLPDDERGAIWSEVDVGPQGLIYVLDTLGDRIAIFDGNGAEHGTIPSPRNAYRAAGGPHGQVFVLTADGQVVRLDTDGRELARFDARQHGGVPPTSLVDLAVDADGYVYVVDSLTSQVTVFAPRGVETEVLVGGHCNVLPDKWAAPSDLLLGAEVEVALSIAGSCGAVEVPSDIVLAVNTLAHSIGNDPGRRLARNLRVGREIAALTDLSRHRLGVVAYAGTGVINTDLTDVGDKLIDALGNAFAGNAAPRLYAGLREADRVFKTRERRRVIVLVDPPEADEAALGLAERLKDDGVLIIAVNGDTGAATSDVYTNLVVEPWEAEGAKHAHRWTTELNRPRVLLQAGRLEDVIPDNMRYVTDSAEPPAAWDTDTRTLTWDLQDVPFEPRTVRFRLEPLAAGLWPTNVRAQLTYTDGWGSTGSVNFPVPEVRVYAEPSPTPTPLPTMTPEPTPTVVPRPIYLPLALDERCVPGQQRIDVVLAIDASTSMLEETDGGLTKLDAARAAAGRFLDALDPAAGDQAAIIAFNETATLVHRLTGDRTALNVALSAIAPETLTCLPCAVEMAAVELRSDRRIPDNAPVLILLTDGRSNPRPAREAVTAAAEAKLAGITIFTIGLGNDLDVDALRDIASEPAYFYRAADAESLAAIYEQIAVTIPCSPEAFWGGR